MAALFFTLIAVGMIFIAKWLLYDPDVCDCPACQFLRAYERSQRIARVHQRRCTQNVKVNWAREGF